MNLNKNLRAQMSKATTAIKKALKEMPSYHAGGAIPRMPDFMRDMDFPSGKSPGATGVLPDFVSDLLAGLGVSSPQGQGSLSKNRWESQPEIRPGAEEKTEAKGSGQFLTKSFTNHAGTRDYKLYIPSSYHGQAMPLMVMLHGCTQTPDDFANGTRMNAVAEEKQCFVVYPAQTKSANSSNCWNWFSAVDQQREQGEPSIIAGITREVISAYKLDTDKVYVAGLSAGGAMAIIMGTTYPDVYAAVGVHSGLPYAAAQDLPSAFSAMRGGMQHSYSQNKRTSGSRLHSIPIIVFHGDQDKTVNARNGDQLMEQNVSDMIFDKHNTHTKIKPDVIVEEGKVPDGHGYTRTSHHAQDGHAIAEHWVIHGAGHAWAGGSKSGSYTDIKGPDATREMMRFFYTQPSPVPRPE